jgi:hypothetical protein
MPNRVQGPTVNGTNTTADRSLTFAENVIPAHGSAVRRLDVVMTGTSMTVANITRISLKANSDLIWDVKPTHLRAIFGFFLKRNALFNSTDTRFSLPLDLAGAVPDAAAPAGAALRLEIEKNSTPTGGPTANLSELVAPEFPASKHVRIIGNTQSVGTSDSNRSLSVPGSGGAILGLVVPDAGDVTLLRVRVGGATVREYTSGDQILQEAEMMRGYAWTAGEPVYLPLDGIPAVQGVTEIVVSTGAGYVADDWTFVTLHG